MSDSGQERFFDRMVFVNALISVSVGALLGIAVVVLTEKRTAAFGIGMATVIGLFNVMLMLTMIIDHLRLLLHTTDSPERPHR